MSETAIKFQNVSGLGVFAAEWETASGSRMALVNSQGEKSLQFGVKPKPGGQWTYRSVTNPGRFGMTKPPGKWGEFAAIVRAFLEAGDAE